MTKPAAILDIDGTLVDSNYFHAIAWYRAMRAHDYTLPMWRIHRAIGHMNIHPDGPDCFCGSTGCFERMCCGLWLERDHGRSRTASLILCKPVYAGRLISRSRQKALTDWHAFRARSR